MNTFLLKKRNNQKGFTLIELLVVISIIALLSSVVLSAVNTARLKARDAAIKTGVLELRKLMEQTYQDNGTYADLQYGSWVPATGCRFIFNNGSTYFTEARNICTNISTNSSAKPDGIDERLFIGNNGSNQNRFSILAYLPGKNTYFCAGSNGRTSDTQDLSYSWNQAGCYSDPTL